MVVLKMKGPTTPNIQHVAYPHHATIRIANTMHRHHNDDIFHVVCCNVWTWSMDSLLV